MDKVKTLIEYLTSNDKETQLLGISLMKTDPNIKTFKHTKYLVYDVYQKYYYFDKIE